MSQDTQRARICEVRQKLLALQGPTSRSIKRVDEITARFELFMRRAFDVELLVGISPQHVAQFIHAKGATGEPAVATKHAKRTVLRLLFRVARQEFGLHNDPTIDLVLPARSMLSARPLTDDEVMLGRSYSLRTTKETRQPAAWALCEATAITAELGHITVADLELDASNGPRVWLHGSRNRENRWGLLNEWGAKQLERRASQVGSGYLIYASKGSGDSRHVSCCNAIRDTLIRAGLDSEPDLKPPSVAAWAGVHALEETGSIDGAALRLGIRSLDTAAKFINFNWRG